MRNYVIISGSSGIGKELTNLLKEEEAYIFATSNQNMMLDPENIKYQKFDVSTETFNLDHFLEEINGLVHCAGRINLKPFDRFTEEDFIEDFRL